MRGRSKNGTFRKKHAKISNNDNNSNKPVITLVFLHTYVTHGGAKHGT